MDFDGYDDMQDYNDYMMERAFEDAAEADSYYGDAYGDIWEDDRDWETFSEDMGWEDEQDSWFDA